MPLADWAAAMGHSIRPYQAEFLRALESGHRISMLQPPRVSATAVLELLQARWSNLSLHGSDLGPQPTADTRAPDWAPKLTTGKAPR